MDARVYCVCVCERAAIFLHSCSNVAATGTPSKKGVWWARMGKARPRAVFPVRAHGCFLASCNSRSRRDRLDVHISITSQGQLQEG